MDIRRAFRKYLKDTNTMGFDGWEKAELYREESLVDAWKKARPEDYYKFYDRRFCSFVDQASGKWLERRVEDEPIRVLISTRCSEQEQVRILAHELRHAFDHERSVEGRPFKWPMKATEFWYNWSEYRATKIDVQVEYYQEWKKWKGEASETDCFEILGGIYGRRVATYLANLVQPGIGRGAQMYFLTRFLAVQRQLQQLLERDVEDAVPVFAPWDITPSFICREYGDLTELCDLWDGMETCPPETTHPAFTRLWRRIGRRTKRQMEQIRREQEEEERREREKREAEIRAVMEELRPEWEATGLAKAAAERLRRLGNEEEALRIEEEALRIAAEGYLNECRKEAAWEAMKRQFRAAEEQFPEMEEQDFDDEWFETGIEPDFDFEDDLPFA